MTLEEFIISHSEDDTSRLILGRDKWPDVDVPLAVNIIECRRKIRQKLPEWYAVPGLIFPDRICAEQSSSSFTANYKASVAGRILSSIAADGRRIADLTGGLGVDSLAFSSVVDKVLYNEMEPSRASAARHNFPLLGAQDIVVTSHCVSVENDAVWTELKSFGPSLIYMDPARRSSSGSKVFLLEDCSPDVLTLTRRLFDIAPNLLVKLFAGGGYINAGEPFALKRSIHEGSARRGARGGMQGTAAVACARHERRRAQYQAHRQ